MNCRLRLFSFIVFLFILNATVAYAEFQFSDERFQGDFSTDNLDRIIQEYELFDGWYWTTPPYITQTFHGMQNAPGWTDTAVNKLNRNAYSRGLYGCRWMANKVLAETPGIGGYGECYGFAQFVGYLLSGEYNPQHKWNFYYNLESSCGLFVGDILRTEFTAHGKTYHHSAVVYSVTEDMILFMQVSGSLYNRIYIGTGFRDGYHNAPVTLEELGKIPNIKICRSPLNTMNQEEKQP